MIVVQLRPENLAGREAEMRCKRLAVQIATMLPESPTEALLVLGYAEALVRDFFGSTAPPQGGFNPS